MPATCCDHCCGLPQGGALQRMDISRYIQLCSRHSMCIIYVDTFVCSNNKILIIKANEMHCFSNLFLVKNSICFRQIYCPSSGVSTLYTQQ